MVCLCVVRLISHFRRRRPAPHTQEVGTQEAPRRPQHTSSLNRRISPCVVAGARAFYKILACFFISRTTKRISLLVRSNPHALKCQNNLQLKNRSLEFESDSHGFQQCRFQGVECFCEPPATANSVRSQVIVPSRSVEERTVVDLPQQTLLIRFRPILYNSCQCFKRVNCIVVGPTGSSK